jgi:hypothetical protein
LWWTGYGSVCQTTESNPYRHDSTNAHSHDAIHYDRYTLSNIYSFPDIGRSDRYTDSIRHKAANQHALANGIAYRNGNTNGHTNIYPNIYFNTEYHTIGDNATYEHANSIPDAYSELHADIDSLSNTNMDSDNYTNTIHHDDNHPAPNRNPLIE